MPNEPRSKISELRDDRGTLLVTYAQMLTEKCDQSKVGCLVMLTYEPNSLAIFSNLDTERIPDALTELAEQMRKKQEKTPAKSKLH